MSYTREQIEAMALDVRKIQGRGDLCQAIFQLLAENDALREDAARLDWLESSKTSHGFCHSGYGDYLYFAHQHEEYPTVRQVLDAARGTAKTVHASVTGEEVKEQSDE